MRNLHTLTRPMPPGWHRAPYGVVQHYWDHLANGWNLPNAEYDPYWQYSICNRGFWHLRNANPRHAGNSGFRQDARRCHKCAQRLRGRARLARTT